MLQASDVLVVVPAYNEGKVVYATVEHLLSAGYQVVVVDDGSQDDTSAVRDLPVTYIRHSVNLGQGAALQTGMTYAFRAGAAIAVHFDADGQHDCSQIERLLEPIRRGEVDVVFGSRFMDKADAAQVPLKKRIALRVGILVSWIMTGVRLTDTHNGFRALSHRALGKVHLQENGFAHATEILQVVRKAKLRYLEVPITVRYSTYSQMKGQRLSNSLNILFDLIVARISR